MRFQRGELHVIKVTCRAPLLLYDITSTTTDSSITSSSSSSIEFLLCPCRSKGSIITHRPFSVADDTFFQPLQYAYEYVFLAFSNTSLHSQDTHTQRRTRVFHHHSHNVCWQLDKRQNALIRGCIKIDWFTWISSMNSRIPIAFFCRADARLEHGIQTASVVRESHTHSDRWIHTHTRVRTTCRQG